MTDYNIKSATTEIVTTASTLHSYFEVMKGVYAYKTVRKTVSSHAEIEDHEFVMQGLTKRSGVTKLRKGLSPEPLHPQRQYVVVSDEILAEVKRFGYLALSARKFKGFDDTEVYDWLINGGSPDNVIAFYSYDHSFWRIDGTLIPTGIAFDYISAGFHNLKYDMPKAVAHLDSRDDVSFFDQEKHRFAESIMGTVAEKGSVLSIPYYNADGGKNAYLSFVWTPTQDQADKLYSGTARRDIFKTIFDDDMLGLRAAGAALFNDFYEEVERKRTCDDCGCSCECD
jgi:hypothetical protein